MAVKYTIHDGEMVSVQWKTVLVEMEKEVPNNVNEGHRTMARQAWFWMCFQTKSCNNGNLAAFPSPFAPHIRTGRIDHAIDFSDGPAAEAWLDRNGVPAHRTVPGESWHAEVLAEALQRFHERHQGDKWDELPRHLERQVRTLISRRKMVRSRIKHRDGIDSKKQPRKWKRRDRAVNRAVRARERSRRKVERSLDRADNPKTKGLLKQVLQARKEKQ